MREKRNKKEEQIINYHFAISLLDSSLLFVPLSLPPLTALNHIGLMLTVFLSVNEFLVNYYLYVIILLFRNLKQNLIPSALPKSLLQVVSGGRLIFPTR